MKILQLPFVFALSVALLVLAPQVCAQTAPLQGNVEQQMSADEFRAAGLEKLTPQELGALNAWLQRKVVQETAKAAETAREEGREEVVRKNRGFFDFGSTEPIESNIVGEFRGFAKGRTYTLENGQVWEQIEPASLAGVRRDNPEVSIKPGMLGNWFLKIKGYNTAAQVRRIK
jgi:hypothetical protein